MPQVSHRHIATVLCHTVARSSFVLADVEEKAHTHSVVKRPRVDKAIRARMCKVFLLCACFALLFRLCLLVRNVLAFQIFLSLPIISRFLVLYEELGLVTRFHCGKFGGQRIVVGER